MTSLGRAAWVALAGSVTIVAACSSSDDTCDCPGSDVTVTIPVDIAPSASAPMLSGTACTGVTPTCSNTAGGCSQYAFTPNATGTCTVEVDSASGVFTANVTIVQGTGCCTGFVASPASAADVVVPEPDGGGG